MNKLMHANKVGNIKYLLMIVLLCSVSQVRAIDAFYTGNDLLDYCEAQRGNTGYSAMRNTCVGYIKGIGFSHQRDCVVSRLPSDQIPRKLASTIYFTVTSILKRLI